MRGDEVGCVVGLGKWVVIEEVRWFRVGLFEYEG